MTFYTGTLHIRSRAAITGMCAASVMAAGFALHSGAQQAGVKPAAKAKPDKPAPAAPATKKAKEAKEQKAKEQSVAEHEETELLSNPTFARGGEGWALRAANAAARAGHGASAVIRLEAVTPGPQSWSHAGAFISDPPAGRSLRFGCWLMGEGAEQTAMVNAFAYDADQKLLANFSAEPKVTSGAWQPFTAEYVVPPGTKQLTVWVINRTPRAMFVSDSHLKVGAAAKVALGRSLGGNGIIRAVEQMAVRVTKDGQTGIVTFPIPGTYRDQVPLSFDVQTTPAQALQSYKWRRRADGNNWVCDVQVAPTGKGCIIKYEALVLVGSRADAVLPKVALPEVTPETRAWTRSTACVQSDDPAIRAKADELAAVSADIETYARRVISFTSQNQGKPGIAFDALDARKALECGGSCTSRANLAAALLRAHGIPARTVAHLPTWAGPLYEHWLVEYWHPGAGWVWLESTLDKFQPQPWTLAVLNVANPEDEDKAFDTLHVRAVMPGAPYLAVIEVDKNLYMADLFKDDAFNHAAPVARLSGTPEETAALFDAARSAFPALAARCEAGKAAPQRARQIEAAADADGPRSLTALLRAEKTGEK